VPTRTVVEGMTMNNDDRTPSTITRGQAQPAGGRNVTAHGESSRIAHPMTRGQQTHPPPPASSCAVRWDLASSSGARLRTPWQEGTPC
jgi:hypothetical protein